MITHGRKLVLPLIFIMKKVPWDWCNKFVRRIDIYKVRMNIVKSVKRLTFSEKTEVITRHRKLIGIAMRKEEKGENRKETSSGATTV